MALFGNWTAIGLGELTGDALRLGSQNVGTGREGTVTEGVLLSYILANLPNTAQSAEQIRDALVSLAGTNRLPVSAVNGAATASNVLVANLAALPATGDDQATYIILDDGTGNADVRYWNSGTNAYVDPTPGQSAEVVNVANIAALPATGEAGVMYLVDDTDGSGTNGIRIWNGTAYEDAVAIPTGTTALQFTVDQPAAIGQATIRVGRWGSATSGAVTFTGDNLNGYTITIPVGVKVDWIDFHGDSTTSDALGEAVIIVDNTANGYPVTFNYAYWNKAVNPRQIIDSEALGIMATEAESGNVVTTKHPNISGNFTLGLLIKMR